MSRLILDQTMRSSCGQVVLPPFLLSELTQSASARHRKCGTWSITYEHIGMSMWMHTRLGGAFGTRSSMKIHQWRFGTWDLRNRRAQTLTLLTLMATVIAETWTPARVC